jgi:site-specific recombinase XerD
MLRDFTRFLESTSRRLILDELNIVNVREFIIYEQGRPVSPYTVQGKVRALKAFSSRLFAEGYLPQNLLAGVRLPKVPSKMIKPLTPDEIDSLMKVQNPLTAIGSRNIAILTAFLDTGVRESGLSNLLFGDAHLEERRQKLVQSIGTREKRSSIVAARGKSRGKGRGSG